MDKSASLRVGVIGVGNMGAAMAARLLALGHRVTVRDLRRDAEAPLAAAGAAVALTAAALAQRCEFTVMAVVDAQQNRAALFDERDAACHALTANQVVVLTSTIAPADTRALAARLASLGAVVVDAPVSGGPARARDGTMSMMVGATDAAYARAAPLLAALSDRVFRVGAEPGHGAAMKLINNMLAAVNLVAAGEACALARRAGLDLATVAQVIAASSGQSWIFDDRVRRVLAGDAVPRARAGLLAKDSALAQAMAAEVDFECPLGALAAQQFATAIAAGLGAADDSLMLRARLEGESA
jgi:3-hydroxyisobutyrate dehydrogenase-like beta-hydroxyacid dehydrogenase